MHLVSPLCLMLLRTKSKLCSITLMSHKAPTLTFLSASCFFSPLSTVIDTLSSDPTEILLIVPKLTGCQIPWLLTNFISLPQIQQKHLPFFGFSEWAEVILHFGSSQWLFPWLGMLFSQVCAWLTPSFHKDFSVKVSLRVLFQDCCFSLSMLGTAQFQGGALFPSQFVLMVRVRVGQARAAWPCQGALVVSDDLPTHSQSFSILFTLSDVSHCT